MSQITTIRRNTKRHSIVLALLARTGGARVYSLENGFTGKPVSGNISAYDRENGKLSEHNGKFTLHVHSNLWYEWQA